MKCTKQSVMQVVRLDLKVMASIIIALSAILLLAKFPVFKRY